MARSRVQNFFLICMLGALSLVSPFSIDMYLSAFQRMAADLHTTSAVVSLTLSSYFIGLALGQILYGPLLDRFGRKAPVYAGFALFILASLGCLFAQNIETLIVLRFFQALGGCSAGVASLAMVRDFFPVNESAKILSLVFLCIGVSPLLAPTVGGLIVTWLGWKWVFIILAAFVVALCGMMVFFLPEGHQPDKTISLKPGPILKTFWHILQVPQFHVYALAGAFSFAGLFTYVAGSPIIFIDHYHISPAMFGGIFACLTMGFIAGNQLNILLLRRYSSDVLFGWVAAIQAGIGVVFLAGVATGLIGFYGTMVLFFVFLSCAGITYPNAAAMALAPFTKNVGSAAAMLGFIQMSVGAFISTGIGILNAHDSLPVITILCLTSALGLAILMLGRGRIHPETNPPDA